MIKTFLDGRVGADAVIKYTPSGKAVAEFNVACTLGKDKTVWVKCVLWEKRAESLGPHIRKGIHVVVSGTPATEAWNGKGDGKPQSKLVVTVDDFSFGGGKASDSETQQQPQRNAAPDYGDQGITDEDIPF